MIGLSMKSDFSRMERALMLLATEQLSFATARALNDCARAARDTVNKAMPEIFDRPTPFTQKAVVAPKELAATKASWAATVTLRPVQAQYLLHEELGGERSPAENLRKAADALVLPGKTVPLDQYGNIPNRFVANLRTQSNADKRQRKRRVTLQRRAAKGHNVQVPAAPPAAGTVVFLPANTPGNKASIGGYFRRLADHQLTRLTIFKAATHYTPRMSYHARVEAAARATWPNAMMQRLREAIATAR